MQTNFSRFIDLHREKDPLLLFNVWNVQSAKACERAGAKAIATSSGAVAETLGYGDGEQMSFDEYFFIIERICKNVSIPFSVDLEAGYGATAEDVVRNIQRLADLGVAGVNIEDSIIEDGKRELVDAKVFATRLSQIMSVLRESNTNIFMNIRCDVFLLGVESAARQGIERGALYANAGAHGLFFPALVKMDEMVKVVSGTKLPVNVMTLPGLPTLSEIKQCGVKRVSMGPFLNRTAYGRMEEVAKSISADQSLSLLFQS